MHLDVELIQSFLVDKLCAVSPRMPEVDLTLQVLVVEGVQVYM